MKRSNHPPLPPTETLEDSIRVAAANPDSPVAKALAQVESIGIPREMIQMPGTRKHFPPKRPPRDYITELAPGLYAGSHEALDLDLLRSLVVQRVVSFAPLPPALVQQTAIRCYYLDVDDDGVIEPERIHKLLGAQRVAYICMLGQNRSSALAAADVATRLNASTAEAVDFVVQKRTQDLLRVDRSGAKVSPQMFLNVEEYVKWWRENG